MQGGVAAGPGEAGLGKTLPRDFLCRAELLLLQLGDAEPSRGSDAATSRRTLSRPESA